MNQGTTVYINPLTDFGFKFLFGREENKEILISFLNSLFTPHVCITDVKYLDKEQLGENKDDRTMIYDLFCNTDRGDHILVEMQNRYQANFKDRVIYYHSKGFVNQGKRGNDWNYLLAPVYGIFITNFINPLFDDEQMVEEVCLMNTRSHEVFSEKLRMFFLKIPEMTKSAEECETDLQKWMYIFKNLEKMRNLPEGFLKEPAFKKLDRVARYGTMTEEEQRHYDHSLKVYRDTLAILNTERAEGIAEGLKEGIEKGLAQGIEKGIEKGIEQGKIIMIRSMVEKGIDMDTITSIANLKKSDILNILNSN